MIKEDMAIPMVIQEEIKERVKVFNEKKLLKSACKYYPDIKGKFIHLMSISPDGSLEKICRLTYNGDLEKMAFAIFKYSTEQYSPSEFCFPGSECVDGTLEGAMKAGIKAYW